MSSTGGGEGSPHQPVNLVTLSQALAESAGHAPTGGVVVHKSLSALAPTPLRIPTVTPQIRPAIIPPRTGGPPPGGVHPSLGLAPLTTSIPVVQSIGHHRLPASITPIPRAPAPVVKSNVVPAAAALALVQAVGEGGPKMAVMPNPHALSLARTAPSATNVSTALPVSLRAASNVPLVKALAPGTPGNPVQFVPIPPGSLRGGTAAVTATIRQTIPFKTGGVGLRGAPVGTDHPVRVTLVSSANPTLITSKSGVTQSQTYLKPLTITSSPIRAQSLTSLGGSAQPGPTVRLGQGASRMTVIPSATGQMNVSLNPVPGPIAVSTNANMARLLTPGTAGNARVLVPQSVSLSPGGVSIQKASLITTSSLGASKTITLPISANTPGMTLPKPSHASQVIPVARVVPQPLLGTQGGPSVSLAPLPLNHPSGLMFASQPINPVHLNVPETSIVLTSVPAQDHAHHYPHHPHHLPHHFGRHPNHPLGSTSLTIRSNLPEHTDKLSSLSTSKPGILRRRDPDHREHHHPVEGDDNDGGSTSGSTTLSATSSPCDNTNYSGDEAVNLAQNQTSQQPSPRKKPRRQQLDQKRDQNYSETEDGAASNGVRLHPGGHNSGSSPEKRRRISTNGLGAARAGHSAKGGPAPPPAHESVSLTYKIKKPDVSLLQSYRHTWKSRHNHFLKYSDVRPKDEKHPTVNELANQKFIAQKVNGWKVHLLSGQMEDVVDMEKDLSAKLQEVQKRLDRGCHKEMSKELNKVQELVKANLQRSRVFQEQIKETKSNTKQIFNHKSQVLGIVKKYESKRHIKKRELR